MDMAGARFLRSQRQVPHGAWHSDPGRLLFGGGGAEGFRIDGHQLHARRLVDGEAGRSAVSTYVVGSDRTLPGGR
jgi:hypothetical protein